jgi:hypothetical protein
MRHWSHFPPVGLTQQHPARKMKIWATSLLLVFFTTHTLAQTATAHTGSGSVEGHVICDDGGTPARFATVRLVPLAKLLDEAGANGSEPKEPTAAWTDLDGYYIFPVVEPGRYLVDVEDDGYIRKLSLIANVLDDFTLKEQKELFAALPQVTVASGGVARSDIVLHRGGAISGRVSFDSGGALNGAEVTAGMIASKLFEKLDEGNGGAPKGLNFSVTVRTDDRGFYRIAGLPEGEYLIHVRLSEPFFRQLEWFEKPVRTGRADLTIFSPQALSKADAKVVTVDQGDEITDVDVNIPTRMLHSISGAVTQNGVPVEHARVSIRPAGQKEVSSTSWATMTIADGSYRIDLLPSGTYVIKAEYRLPKVSQASASREITVVLGDDNLLDTNIDLRISSLTK